MTMMVKFWRNFRLGMLALMFLGTFFYLLATFPFAKYLGRTPTYSREIAEGQPIVDAIYRFKAERGLWPQYLDDLAPDYLPKRPSLTWNYKVLPGGPSLARLTPGSNEDIVGYDFDPSTPAWRAMEGYGDRILQRRKPPALPAPPPAKLVENELAELDRRIVNDHGYMVHYRAKASLLRSLGRIDDARAVIAAAKASNATHFWPKLAAAVIDLSPASTASAPATAPASAPAALPESAAAFEKWVHDQPTFSHWYYLSLLDRLAGRDAEALTAIEEAIKLPPAVAEDDMSPPALFLWDMARFALAKSRYDLVLQITDAWDKMQSDRRREENSYLALAAGAKLAKGDTAGALADMKKLTARKSTTWAKNLEPLRDAIDRGDVSFRYDPGPNPPPYQVFQLPE